MVRPLPPVAIVTLVVTENCELLVLTPNTGALAREVVVAYSMPETALKVCTKAKALIKSTLVTFAPQKLPAAHWVVHALAFEKEEAPAAQGVQAGAPAAEEKVPGGHATAPPPPPTQKEPAGQARTEPSAPQYAPGSAGQGEREPLGETVGEQVGERVNEGVRDLVRDWVRVFVWDTAATPKSAKESMVTVPVPVAEPKHALIHTEGRLSRIPVVAGMPAAPQVWKSVPATPIVALAATLVHVVPLLVLYQNWYGIAVELTLMNPMTLRSLPTCTCVNPVVDVFIITPPHVELPA